MPIQRVVYLTVMFAVSLRGGISVTVRSTVGEAVMDVSVRDLTGCSGYGKTTSNGTLLLSDCQHMVLLLTRKGYRPAVQVVDAGVVDRNLVVTLEPDNGTGWTAPVCGRPGPGVPMKTIELKPPRGVRFKRFGDVDFSGYKIDFQEGKHADNLVSMSGTHASDGSPSSFWMMGLTQFEARSFHCGEFDGIDIRGFSPDGKQSRWVGYFYSFVEYSRVSKEAADFFDRIISQACCR